VSATVLLDAGPLGVATNPRSSVENELCKNWLSTLVYSGALVIIPEIADYEVRRELLRADKRPGIARLDALKALLAYEPITTTAMLRAAEFWSTARKMGKQSAADAALDADMILAAQAAELSGKGHDAIIATTNLRHLSLFAPAKMWSDIRAS
jgi:hypothetical protein